MLVTTAASETAENNRPKCCCVPLRPGVGTCERLPLLPAIALVVLPKCPLCLAAWLGIVGSPRSNSWLSVMCGTPLALGLLSFALAALALGARHRRDPRPLLVGMLGAAALLASKSLMDQPLLMYTGLGLFAGASFWSRLRGPAQRRYRRMTAQQ